MAVQNWVHDANTPKKKHRSHLERLSVDVKMASNACRKKASKKQVVRQRSLFYRFCWVADWIILTSHGRVAGAHFNANGEQLVQTLEEMLQVCMP